VICLHFVLISLFNRGKWSKSAVVFNTPDKLCSQSMLLTFSSLVTCIGSVEHSLDANLVAKEMHSALKSMKALKDQDGRFQ
jgi:hypothetical protein